MSRKDMVGRIPGRVMTVREETPGIKTHPSSLSTQRHSKGGRVKEGSDPSVSNVCEQDGGLEECRNHKNHKKCRVTGSELGDVSG